MRRFCDREAKGREVTIRIFSGDFDASFEALPLRGKEVSRHASWAVECNRYAVKK